MNTAIYYACLMEFSALLYVVLIFDISYTPQNEYIVSYID